MNAAIAIFDGVDDLDVFGPYEVLVNAAQAGADLGVELRAVTAADEIRTSHGARLRPDGVLTPDRLDLLIVPGGGWNDRAERGAWAQAQAGTLPGLIRAARWAGATIASVCTGAGIVAAAGVLDGRPVSTHRAAVSDLREQGLDVVAARVVDDGDVLSAGGVTSGLDLALWLVQRWWGKEMADRIATEIEYERSAAVHHGPHSAR